MVAAHGILVTTPSAMDTHRMGSVKDASLFTSFTSTQRSPKEELKTRTSSWFGRPPILKNGKSMMSSQALTLEMNHEFSADNSAFPAGRLLATPEALALLDRVNRSPLEFLSRYLRGNWGDLCQDDKTENELSLKQGFRLLSSYSVSEAQTLWILTEADSRPQHCCCATNTEE